MNYLVAEVLEVAGIRPASGPLYLFPSIWAGFAFGDNITTTRKLRSKPCKVFFLLYFIFNFYKTQ